jgi:predicted nucleic acid-binding protein
MGTFRKPQLNDFEICRRYGAGESRCTIGLAAKLLDHEVLEVLRRNGVRLRSTEEIKRARARRTVRFARPAALAD